MSFLIVVILGIGFMFFASVLFISTANPFSTAFNRFNSSIAPILGTGTARQLWDRTYSSGLMAYGIVFILFILTVLAFVYLNAARKEYREEAITF